MKSFKTLSEMYNSSEYEWFISDKLGNDLFINDPERAERLHDAAEFGTDGSTHAETIEDWRDFLNTLKVFDPEFDMDEDDDITKLDLSRYDILLETKETIEKEIASCEEWHEKNGSLKTAKG